MSSRSLLSLARDAPHKTNGTGKVATIVNSPYTKSVYGLPIMLLALSNIEGLEFYPYAPHNHH